MRFLSLRTALEHAGEGIVEMLLALDDAAGAYGRRVAFVLDEFQQLSELQTGAPRSLEGAVRHAVERARNALERDDLIQQEAEGSWRLVDPAMAAWLRRL